MLTDGSQAPHPIQTPPDTLAPHPFLPIRFKLFFFAISRCQATTTVVTVGIWLIVGNNSTDSFTRSQIFWRTIKPYKWLTFISSRERESTVTVQKETSHTVQKTVMHGIRSARRSNKRKHRFSRASVFPSCPFLMSCRTCRPTSRWMRDPSGAFSG